MKKIYILFITIIILASSFLFLNHIETTSYFGITTANQIKIDDIIMDLKKEYIKIDLYLDGKYKLPAMSEREYLVTQNIDKRSFQGIISSQSDYNYLFKEMPFQKLKDISMSNQCLNMVVYNDKIYDNKYVCITSLPLLNISTTKKRIYLLIRKVNTMEKFQL